MNGDGESRTRDMESDRAGWVRVELRVRHAGYVLVGVLRLRVPLHLAQTHNQRG